MQKLTSEINSRLCIHYHSIVVIILLYIIYVISVNVAFLNNNNNKKKVSWEPVTLTASLFDETSADSDL